MLTLGWGGDEGVGFGDPLRRFSALPRRSSNRDENAYVGRRQTSGFVRFTNAGSTSDQCLMGRLLGGDSSRKEQIRVSMPPLFLSSVCLSVSLYACLSVSQSVYQSVCLSLTKHARRYSRIPY